MTAGPQAAIRRRIRVRGVVQGVGFRPFVYRHAIELELAGSVHNDAEGVAIDVQGACGPIETLLERLHAAPPPLARIEAIEVEHLAPEPARRGFTVGPSLAGRTATEIGADTATCASCLAELLDPADRRYRYALINCTDCGPRYTLTRALPYDRANTSLDVFPLCPACSAEYASPGHRRFHAEATACPECGPRLSLESECGQIAGDPIATTLACLRAGLVVAIKGLGGFHLACDARNLAAVHRLRSRKHRDQQPFAVMAANVASAQKLVRAGPEEERVLSSRARPIVLLERAAGDTPLPGIADGLPALGIMLPYTPIHYLLFHEAAGRPPGDAWLESPQTLALVMTSGNAHGEPLARDNAEARSTLAGIADAWLLHDRDILARCDDSVVRVRATRPHFVRRSRGVAPEAIRLARPGPAVLGVGGHYKVTACLSRGADAFLSPHLGDLESAASRRACAEALAHLERILDTQPAAIAHDLHPDFYTTDLARRLAAVRGIPLVGVQHHHAHVAAVLAEHGVEEPALGLAVDGTGYGADGGVWGGELLLVRGGECTRLGHLRELPLPGGDRAAREPWRMAAAALHLLGRGAEIGRRFRDQPAASTVATLLERQARMPLTSSLGRWFDAAAGLLGICPVASYEGQAAMQLEGLASLRDPGPREARVTVAADGTLDLLPLLEPLVDRGDAGAAASEFHSGLADALAFWLRWGAARTGLSVIALAGGCCLNARLMAGLRAGLADDGLLLLEAERLPPNDGAISLGQVWVAQRLLEQPRTQ